MAVKKKIDPLAIDTTYYDRAIADYNKMVDENTTSQLKRAEGTAAEQLRQAYISNMQNRNALQDRLAMAGIRGGGTETANLRLMSNYQNARGGIRSNLATTAADLNRGATQQKGENTAAVNAARQAYLDNTAQANWQASREDSQTDYANKVAEEERNRAINIERWTARYSKYYSVNELKKLLKKVTNPDQIAIINTRIGYIRKAKKKY